MSRHKSDQPKHNGGQLKKAALPAIGAAVLAAFVVAQSRKRKSAKK